MTALRWSQNVGASATNGERSTENPGHADTRTVQRHYAHLENDYVREQIAKSTAAFTVSFEGTDVVAV